LIAGLTSPKDRVALLSSFETKILIQAKRGPFFYYFPMIESAGMELNHFRGTALYTRSRMQKTLEQLENAKPAYIFVEKRLVRRQLSPEIYRHFETLTALLDYVDRNYQADQEGKYLVAMKRKPADQTSQFTPSG
jgi:hypothetical protein